MPTLRNPHVSLVCARASDTHTQRAADTEMMRLHFSAQPRCPYEPASDSARRFDAGGCAQRAALEMRIPASTNSAYGVYTHSPLRCAIARVGTYGAAVSRRDQTRQGRSRGDAAHARARKIAGLASLRLSEGRRLDAVARLGVRDAASQPVPLRLHTRHRRAGGAWAQTRWPHSRFEHATCVRVWAGPRLGVIRDRAASVRPVCDFAGVGVHAAGLAS
ncbi:hypothetical protein C8J57DRAFT_1706982 [Mycena rebaudengoi]|nr:hypothetical protein C8J57DRAFT_1706982 [Mycena rebaudengoi]